MYEREETCGLVMSEVCIPSSHLYINSASIVQYGDNNDIRMGKEKHIVIITYRSLIHCFEITLFSRFWVSYKLM